MERKRAQAHAAVSTVADRRSSEPRNYHQFEASKRVYSYIPTIWYRRNFPVWLFHAYPPVVDRHQSLMLS